MLSVTELPNAADLIPQKLSSRDTPHAAIEVNSECNIRCRHCYNIDRPAVKPLTQIRAELAQLMRRRRLDTLSLVGGEPTLHPQIVDIVAAVKQQGLVCQLLTNGVVFLQDADDRLLGELVAAGVDRFLIHIDEGQRHVHPDIDAARNAVFERLEQHEVGFALSVTVLRGQETSLPRLLRQFARYRFFEGLFVAMAMDMATAFAPERSTARDAELGMIDASMLSELGVRPTTYVPSNLDDETICWLMYFYYVNVETGARFGLSPRYNRKFRRLYRRLKGREFFGEPLRPPWFSTSLALTALAEVLIRPRRIGEIARLLWRSGGTHSLRFHYVVIQEPPRYSPKHGRVELCHQCPDATLRQGQLTPVCVASWLSPADGSPARAPAQAVRDIYEHLEERAVA